MKVLLFSLVLFIVQQPVFMVKRQDFKTCEQSSFCRRHRAYADLVDEGATDGASFSFVPSSFSLDEDKGVITAQLMGLEPTNVFLLQLDFLKDNVVRMRISERDSLHPRYNELPNFVLQDAGSTKFVKQSLTKDQLKVVFGTNNRNTLTVTTNPFNVELTVNKVTALTFNDRNYLYYEKYRSKEDTTTTPRFSKKAVAKGNETLDETATRLNKLKDDFVYNQWDESFAGRTDTKPRGPAAIGFDVSFPGSNNVYGLPEHASDFSLRATRGKGSHYTEPYRLYNLDVFEYEIDSPMALYGAIPFLLSHKKGQSTGVLWLNAAEMWVDIEKSRAAGTSASAKDKVSTHWMSESGALDLFLFAGPTQAEIFDAYSALTGRSALPQLFAIAYHQCRWNYNTEEDVKTVDAGFDQHKIPYDVLWLDIEHTDGKRYFTWDKSKFPDPEGMQKSLAAKGRKMVTIIDPHIKKDDNYYISKLASSKDLFIKNADGSVFNGWCWPGESNWIDYTNPAARSMWISQFNFNAYKGSTPTLYTWNDMNEPAIFNSPEMTAPKDCLHYNNWEHRDLHNMYGMLFHQSTFEGHLARMSNNDRPFILSRSFFVGTQRYGAIWTGDNYARWEDLAASVHMILSVSVAGVVFSGADVGGFFGNPDPELLVRWYQIGSLQPFFRAHAHIETKRREPWLFDEPYTSLIRDAVTRRYKLLPYIYTLFSEATLSGIPVMRAMVYEFPDDEYSFEEGDQYMLGSGLLIRPVTQAGQKSVDVYLPKSDVWYNYKTLDVVKPNAQGIYTLETPLSAVPVFLRGGTILPRRDRIRRSSHLMRGDPYTIVVSLAKDSTAKGSLYIDDGSSFAYQKGDYVFTEFEFKKGVLSGTPKRLGGFSSQEVGKSALVLLDMRVERIRIIGLAKSPESVAVGGSQVKFKWNSNILTVKNPPISVGKKWSVELK